ncbi:putative ribonuclease H-like domain-containing protein [Tanacetum coccineum]
MDDIHHHFPTTTNTNNHHKQKPLTHWSQPSNFTILKTGEYDILGMKMRNHYLGHTDYPIWEVIQTGNGLVSVSTDTNGVIKIWWNDGIKEDARVILKQQFEGFTVSNSKGIHKGYDRFQSLLSQLEIHGAGVSTEDANQKFLRVFESDVKGSTASSSSTQNVAFVSENTSSTNEVSTAYGVSNSSGYKLYKVDNILHHTLSLLINPVVHNWIMRIWNSLMRHFARECRSKGNQDSRRRDAWNTQNKDKDNGRRSGKQEEPKALVTLDGEAVQAKKQREQLGDASIEIQAYTQALKKVEATICSSSTNPLWNEKLKKKKEELKAKVEKWHNSSKSLNILLISQMSARDKARLGSSDIEDSPVNNRYAEGKHAVPPPMTGIYIPSGPDNDIDDLQFTYGPKQSKPSESDARNSDFTSCESNSSEETHESMSESVINESKVVSQLKVWTDAPIIEEYESDSDDEHVSLPSKEHETPSFANNIKHVKTPRQTVKQQNTCSKSPKPDKNFSHLIRDCDLHKKRMAKQAEVNKRMCKGTGQRENRPVWNNVNRVNHQNQFVPTAVLTRTGKIQVNTARASSTNNVNTVRASSTKNVSTAIHNFNSQAVPTNAARKVNTVKPIVNNDYPQRALKNKGIVDSGCSRHMTGNKSHLAKYQDYNGGPVSFRGSKGYITGKGKGPNWLFDLDYLTDSMNYQHVRSENQANKHAGPKEANHIAGTQDNIDAGNSEMEAESAQDYFVLPIWSSYTSTIKSSEANNEGKKYTKNTDLKTNENPVDLEDQAFLDELERLKRQEKEANDAAEALRKEFAQNTEDLLLQAGAARVSSTNTVNTASTPVSTASPSGGLSFTHLTNTNQDDLEIPNLEDSYDNPNDDLPYGKKAIRTKWVYKIRKGGEWKVVLWLELRQDVKSAFLYGKIDKEVYVSQHLGFVDPKYSKKVYKVVKALYGLHQAPRAWYATLSTFLLKSGYRRGTIDKTLFIKKDKNDIMLVQVYVDVFEALMKSRFQMSSMGELTFFLGLQTASTPVETQKPLVKDEEAVDVDVYLYRSKIGSLMYLIASRPDIMFAVCACSRFQVTPKTSHLNAVKRIFRRLISWQCKKQTIVATSIIEAEYVATANCCGQVLWIQNQMLDYGFNFMNTKIYIDNESTICIVKNPVFHSKTKHIEIRHHFIRDAYEKKLIQVLKIHTDDNVADLLTKAFDVSRFNFLIVNIGMINQ